MRDIFNREIDYLRIAVTDRCNLRCRYCMPEEGVPLLSHDDILRFEEIVRLVRIAAILGIKRVRLTGGEPLVRLGIVGLVEQIAHIPGIEDVAMTTNGLLLASFSDALKQAGLKRVNISLDTLRPGRFQTLTRGGELAQVLKGLDAALQTGFTPVKINCVLMKGFNEDEVDDFVSLAREKPVHVRFIELMPIGEGETGPYGFISAKDVLRTVKDLQPVAHVEGAGPARYFRPGSDAPGTVGVITALSEHFCGGCNRLRLTADGKLKPCLYSQQEIDVKAALRSGSDDHEIMEILRLAVWQKPAAHHMLDEPGTERKMSQIGG